MNFIIKLLKEIAKLIGVKVMENMARSLIKGETHAMPPAEKEEVNKLKKELEICKKNLEECANEKRQVSERLDEVEKKLQVAWLIAAITTASTVILALILLWR